MSVSLVRFFTRYQARNPPHPNLSGAVSAVFALLLVLFAVSFTNHDYNYQLKVYTPLDGSVRHSVLGAKLSGNIRAADNLVLQISVFMHY